MAVKKEAQTKEVEASQNDNKKDVKLTKGQLKSAKYKGMAKKYMCVHHGKEIVEDNFYKVNKGSLFKGLDRLPVCKDCVRKIYINYYHQTSRDAVQAVYMTCRKLDIKFDHATCQAAIERSVGVGEDVFQWYIQMHNSLQQNTTPSSFDDSDQVELKKSFEDAVREIQGTSTGKLEPDAKKAQREILKLMNYDPFKDSGMNDYMLSRCYIELLSWLDSDDELVDDPYKMSVILQLVNSNAQVKQIDLFISLLSNNVENFKENIATLASLNNTKSKLVDGIVKVYKENKDWLKTDGSTNKNKLGAMMKRYREYGFEVDTNYYDMLTSKALKEILDLSHQSISEIINFGEAEQREIILIQRELLAQKDKEIAKEKEEKRAIAIELKEIRDGVKNG